MFKFSEKKIRPSRSALRGIVEAVDLVFFVGASGAEVFLVVESGATEEARLGEAAFCVGNG